MRIALIFILVLSLLGCHQPHPNTLTVGTISGPETDLVKVAKEVAFKKDRLTIKIIEFTDYNLPNEALADGSLDANVFQHLPYLQAATKAHGYDFKVIGKAFIYPIGMYSKKIKSITELKNAATIAIPNDPSDETRALLLLQKAGLITLHNSVNATPRDIRTNPKQLKIKELDAAQLPRVLEDVDAAIINTTFAITAGLDPSQNAIFIEDKDSPYANLIVTRKNSDKKRLLQKFVEAFHSQEVKDKAKELFKEGAIPAW